MTTYQTSSDYSREQIATIYQNSPKTCARIVGKDPQLVLWLKTQINFDSDHVPELIYALLNPDENAYCGQGNKRRFRNINVGWSGCGDRKCESCRARAYDKTRETNKEKYGVENVMHQSDIKTRQKASCLESRDERINKTRQTYLERYGVDHYWKTEEGQAKRLKTLETNHGVDNPSKSETLRLKRQQTFLERFGSHPLANELIKSKIAENFLNKYGVKNPSELPAVREKARQTSLVKHGVEYASQSDVFKTKIQETMLSRYGVKSPMHVPEIKQRGLERKRREFFQNLNARTQGRVKPLFDLEEYTGVESEYSWQCTTCDHIFIDNLDDGWVPRCTHCYPVSKSQGEDALYSYIRSLTTEDIIRNTRSIISPLELDIYIPAKNLAFEFNGVYRHSEISGGKNKDYHLTKYQMAVEKNIRLIQIFDTEWYANQEIVKSKIAHLLGLSYRIYARQCVIAGITTEAKNRFLIENHMQGTCISSINLGLFSEGNLVAVMTFGKSRFNKNAEWELLRYCSSKNVTVVGGAARLLRCFEQQYNFPSIVSYCDLRYGTGKMYEAIGFTLIGQTNPNYWYMKNYQNLETRIRYQKHKLSKLLPEFDATQSEWTNMQKNGYDRIWDCGSSIYLKNPGAQ